jgi:hypothetical protein
MRQIKELTGDSLLNFLLKLTPEQRKNPVIIIDEDYSTSKPALQIKKAPHNLLWDGSDDPSELKTRNAWIADGYDPEEVDGYDIEVCKDDIVIYTHVR